MSLSKSVLTILLSLLCLSAAAAQEPVQAPAAVKRKFDPLLIPDDFYTPQFKAVKPLMAAGDFKGVLSELSKPQKKKYTSSDMLKVHLLRGISYQNLEQDKDAIRSFNAFLEEKASNGDARYLRSLSQRNLGNPAGALESLEEALWFNKIALVKPELIHVELAAIYKEQGKTAKAEENLQKALAANPGSDLALTEIARNHINAGKKDEALRTARQALQANPESDQSRLLLAKSLLIKPNRLTGLEHIKEARTISHELSAKQGVPIAIYEEAARLYIQSLMELGELPEAEKKLLEIGKKNPNDPNIEKLRQQLKIEKLSAEQNSSAEEAKQ